MKLKKTSSYRNPPSWSWTRWRTVSPGCWWRSTAEGPVRPAGDNAYHGQQAPQVLLRGPGSRLRRLGSRAGLFYSVRVVNVSRTSCPACQLAAGPPTPMLPRPV